MILSIIAIKTVILLFSSLKIYNYSNKCIKFFESKSDQSPLINNAQLLKPIRRIGINKPNLYQTNSGRL